MKCEGKRRHASLQAAMIQLKRQPLKALAPYQCKNCGGWHLGQNKKGDRHFQSFMDRVFKADKGRAAITQETRD